MSRARTVALIRLDVTPRKVPSRRRLYRPGERCACNAVRLSAGRKHLHVLHAGQRGPHRCVPLDSGQRWHGLCATPSSGCGRTTASRAPSVAPSWPCAGTFSQLCCSAHRRECCRTAAATATLRPSLAGAAASVRSRRAPPATGAFCRYVGPPAAPPCVANVAENAKNSTWRVGGFVCGRSRPSRAFTMYFDTTCSRTAWHSTQHTAHRTRDTQRARSAQHQHKWSTQLCRPPPPPPKARWRKSDTVAYPPPRTPSLAAQAREEFVAHSRLSPLTAPHPHCTRVHGR
eukprot:scaffold1700_cov106-Isochrysis_galbana.AAC.2